MTDSLVDHNVLQLYVTVRKICMASCFILINNQIFASWPHLQLIFDLAATDTFFNIIKAAYIVEWSHIRDGWVSNMFDWRINSGQTWKGIRFLMYCWLIANQHAPFKGVPQKTSCTTANTLHRCFSKCSESNAFSYFGYMLWVFIF